MDDDIHPPRVFRRQCGGWLALSAKGDSLQIGVTADSEEEVRAKFRASLTEWAALLEGAGRGQDGLSPDGM